MKRQDILRDWGWTGLLLGLVVGLFLLSDPFPEVLVTQKTSIQGLSRAQKVNLRRASESINGLILRPGEIFSLNRQLGPRTEQRGYALAPSYVEGESPKTLGGGICLLASLVYQLALASNNTILERVPHTKTTQTVLPGLDATLWYGKADLRFKNTSPSALKIGAQTDGQTLTVTFRGRKTTEPATLWRHVQRENSQEIRVTVFKRDQGQDRLVSTDHYWRASLP